MPKPIAPLILIGLVENAFKHGVRADPEGATVAISLKLENEGLKFSVRNSRPEEVASPTGPHGLGLVNLRSQLELLYPNHHTLQIEDSATSFLVKLSLELNTPPT
ncbi:MAG: LytS/YehU family sensor histidine kinase [Neolewinella sp.]|jgi:two-component system LytT family sensor kinase